MMDRNISRKLKGKVLDSCVVPSSMVALSEQLPRRLQVCENNRIRRITGVKKENETLKGISWN